MRTKRYGIAIRMALLAALAPSAVAATDPDDPLYAGSQWGPRQIRSVEAWSQSTGAGIVIAILDSGVDLSHPDLAAKLVPGATFFACTAGAPCGNGHWLDGPPASVPSPHGTHVAGIAAAVTDNALGIAGVARDAQLMPIKVIDEDGGNTDDIAAAIDWAREHGAHVINMSLGTAPGTQGLEIVGSFENLNAAVDRAIEAGIVVVAAAGNDAASGCSEPAFHPDILCVVATDEAENRAAYSNFAIDPGLNVVAGPGGASVPFCSDNIVSSVPPGAWPCAAGSGYAFMAGTSMASPHVAGVAALLLAQGRSAANTYDALRETARTPVTGERGSYTPTFGFGIVDAEAALNYLPEPSARAGLLFGFCALACSRRASLRRDDDRSRRAA